MSKRISQKIFNTPSKTLRHYRGSPLTGSPNTAYTTHFVRPNFGKAETSFMLESLVEIGRFNKEEKPIKYHG